MFSDFVLTGKLVFYEKGIIFVDNRVYCLVMSYEDIEEITFHSNDEIWLQFKTKQQNSMPLNLIVGDTFYIKLSY